MWIIILALLDNIVFSLLVRVVDSRLSSIYFLSLLFLFSNFSFILMLVFISLFFILDLDKE